MTNVFFNPYADNQHGEENAKKITELLTDENCEFIDLSKIDLKKKLSDIPESDKIVIAGGDGTIQFIINKLGGKLPERRLYYYPTGCGNDFSTDIKDKVTDSLMVLNDYLKNLPTVSVNGSKRIYFVNGIGYGIDGYCCEEGDKLKKQTTKPINYASIAIKGMLAYFKPRSAVITVDGEKREYENVWLAPTMNGRYYGGGMKIAPMQDRLNPERKLTTIVFHCKSKLKTLMVFPKIFKGEHIKYTKMVDVLTGHDITVEFNKPTPLQIDGETYVNVKRYNVLSNQEVSTEENTRETAANS